MQAVAPAALLNSVAEVLPVPLAKEPAGASVQANAPVVLLNVPAAQSVAVVLPVPAA